MIDVASYISPPRTFSDFYHLESTDPTTNPNYTVWQGEYIYAMKGDHETGAWIGGWPMDTFVVDNTQSGFIYQLTTEEDYTDPHDYKIFRCGLNGKGGLPWIRREIDPNDPSTMQPLVCTTPNYDTYIGCKKTASQSLGLAVCTPFYCAALSYGEDLGVLPTVGVLYQYGSTLASLEIHCYALGYGPAWWRYYQNGVLISSKLKNKIVANAGGSPAPYFPCGLPA